MSKAILEILVGLGIILAVIPVLTLLGIPAFYLIDPGMFLGTWTFLHIVESLLCGLLTVAVLGGTLFCCWMIGSETLEPKKKRGVGTCLK